MQIDAQSDIIVEAAMKLFGLATFVALTSFIFLYFSSPLYKSGAFVIFVAIAIRAIAESAAAKFNVKITLAAILAGVIAGKVLINWSAA